MRPDATIEGFAVQEMVRMPSSHELLLGMTRDPVFGPVIMFGHGGTAVEVIRDHAVAIPPLTLSMATELVGRTRIARLLAGYPGPGLRPRWISSTRRCSSYPTWL